MGVDLVGSRRRQQQQQQQQQGQQQQQRRRWGRGRGVSDEVDFDNMDDRQVRWMVRLRGGVRWRG
jgi:hypothetical protein